ncbi:MAG: EAL domain-containing protein, partial [Burkholderiales bacterium]|nr:EAL domain-containing protein [Burkholderiales bacterium]
GARRRARAVLGRAGFVVAEAADAVQALDALGAQRADLVLMDACMPGQAGFAACTELRRLAGGERIPVVMMARQDDVASIDRALEAGADDFVTKPIDWPLLARRVQCLLRASSAIAELERKQQRLSNAQRIGVMGDWEWTVGENRIVPSEQARRIFGNEPPETSFDIDGLLMTTHPDDVERLRGAFERALDHGDSFALDHRVVLPDGSLRHVQQRIEVIDRDPQGHALRLAGAVQDITHHKEAEEQIRRLAYYDPLTGLPNRHLITQALVEAIAQAERQRQRVGLLFVDLDHFKRVNDTLGHGAGDELLRVVSARLAGSLRGPDLLARPANEEGPGRIARLGGDEFIVLLPDLQGADAAAAVARRLVAALAEPLSIAGHEVRAGASVGIAIHPEDGADADTLLTNADTAMYRAKQAGGGHYHFYNRSMNERALARLALQAELRRALERGEFILHYQPRLNTASGRIVGAEALIRWRHPRRGMVPPADFMALVEENGLVVPIGEWAIDEACRQNAAWQAAGLPRLPVAVNLAPSHLRERGLPERVARALRRHALDPAALEIEVTEAILVTEPELGVDVATRLGAMGVRLSIDDFGTGYSSLARLKRLPLHAIKIDRSFVRDLALDRDGADLVAAIIALAHSL